MALVQLNPLFRSMRGRVGDVVYRQINGRTFISAVPAKSTVPPSPAQLAHRERFAAMVRARAAAARRRKQSPAQ